MFMLATLLAGCHSTTQHDARQWTEDHAASQWSADRGANQSIVEMITTMGEPYCHEWLQEGGPLEEYKHWLSGYLSGTNTMFHAVYKDADYDVPHDPLSALPNPEQAFSYISNYCQANPSDNVAKGAAALFMELLGRKISTQDYIKRSPGSKTMQNTPADASSRHVGTTDAARVE